MTRWQWLPLALVLLAGCASGAPGESSPDDAGMMTAPAAIPGPLRSLPWRALAAAGDDSAPVFDNAVDRMNEILKAKGVARVDRFTSDPDVATPDRPAATAENMTSALVAAPPAPGQGCLVFLTSHGDRHGLLLRDDLAQGRLLDPSALGRILDQGCGTAPTVAIVSGCFSGIFIGRMTAAPNRIILTAARDDRTSFGCSTEEQYTYFDDCLFRAWPKSASFAALYRATDACVRAKENDLGAVHSEPQAFFGNAVTNLALP